MNKTINRLNLKFISIFTSVLTGAIIAVNLSTVMAATVSQAYQSSKALSLGTVVSVQPNGRELTEASLDNESKLVGVVIDTDESVIDVQPEGSDIRVGVTGQVTILVSNISGDIKAGDNLVISPIKGVAAKDFADTKAKKYVAIASQDFNGRSDNSKKISVDYNDGSKKDVQIGTITAKMNLVDRPNDAILKEDNFFVALISRLVGKQVNRTQLLAATAVFITTFLVTGFMLQGSIRGSFIAMGRNPLSKSIIISNLFKILAIGLLVLEIGAAASYIILII